MAGCCGVKGASLRNARFFSGRCSPSENAYPSLSGAVRDRKICASLTSKRLRKCSLKWSLMGRIDLHADDSHAAALPQQLFHLFAKISAFYAEGLVVHLNIRIAGNAEHSLFKYVVHLEHMVSVGEQNILSENIARRCLRQDTTGGSDAGTGSRPSRSVFLWLSSAAICSTLPSRCRNGWCESTICGERTGAMISLKYRLMYFLFVRRKRIHCQSA